MTRGASLTGTSETPPPRHTITGVLASAWVVLLGYLLGSIPVAFLVARSVGVDLRTVGSGNLGATNALRTLGAASGGLVAVLDMAKGALAVLAAQRWPVTLTVVAAAGVGAVCGHVAPVWLGCRGGKGVATGAGVLGVLAPVALLVGLVVFGLTAWTTRYVWLASCVAAGGVVVSVIALREPLPVMLAACGIAGLVWVRHRENLARWRAGSEPRLFASGPHAAR